MFPVTAYCASGAVIALPCDVTSKEQVQNLFAAAEERFGTVDVVINNAGLGGTARLVEMTDEQWGPGAGRDAQRHHVLRQGRADADAAEGLGVIVDNASVIGWQA